MSISTESWKNGLHKTFLFLLFLLYFTRDRTYDTLVIIKLDRRDFIAFGNSSFLKQNAWLARRREKNQSKRKMLISTTCRSSSPMGPYGVWKAALGQYKHEKCLQTLSNGGESDCLVVTMKYLSSVQLVFSFCSSELSSFRICWSVRSG